MDVTVILGGQWNYTLHPPLIGPAALILHNGVIINRCPFINPPKHPRPTFPYLHNDNIPTFMVRREVINGELHPVHVKLEQLVHPVHFPEAAAIHTLGPPWHAPL
uniref:Uncharacterized protein n=1 Tax=Arundo donax TaxID=35708 RepID=A0A0A9BMP7_ARUDO